MPTLKFYDVSKKESLETDKYKLRTRETKKGTKYFAVAINDKGKEVWRIVSKDFYDKNKSE